MLRGVLCMFLSINSGKSIDVHPSWYVVSETTTVMTQLYVGKTLVFCRFVQNRISQNPLVNLSQSGHTWGYPPFSDSKLPAPNQMLPSPWIAGFFFSAKWHFWGHETKHSSTQVSTILYNSASFAIEAISTIWILDVASPSYGNDSQLGGWTSKNHGVSGVWPASGNPRSAWRANRSFHL